MCHHFLTILTPTYNRASSLEHLYHSLKQQKEQNFEWLIVDDGSTDNTADVVEHLTKTSNFPIRYIYKKNGGKHTALNIGIPTVKSEMTFIVDSDDTLTSNATQEVQYYGLKYRKDNNICGISFLRQFQDGIINGRLFRKNELIGTYIEVRVNGKDMNGDKAEVFYTSILKGFPFPEFPGEKFLGEDCVWVSMARQGFNMVHVNSAIYIGNYEQNGLTRNRRINNIHSPLGCMYRANLYLYKDINWKFRQKSSLQYLVYGWFAKKRLTTIIASSNCPFLTIMDLCPARIIYLVWKRQYLHTSP